MGVSDGFRQFVLEQLSRILPDLRARSMFGGVGIYAGDLFFALLDDDVLYFKTDHSNRPRFESRGMGPFRPSGEAGEVMQYYEVPADVLEDVEMLGEWVESAVEVARKARRGRSGRRRV
ncbi:MAG TPA: TfoX/Sxy family protein [Gemmatimonadales bacterium]